MKIRCPRCQAVFELPSTTAGTILTCPCGAKMRIPRASSVASQPSTEAEEPDPTEPSPKPHVGRPEEVRQPAINPRLFDQPNESTPLATVQPATPSTQNIATYSPFTSETGGRRFSNSDIDPTDEKKIRSIIREGNRIMVSTLVCFLCCCCMIILFPPWYYFRLRQWEKYSQKYPTLLDTMAAPGSLPHQFQACRKQLRTGFIIGTVTIGVYALLWIVSLTIQMLGLGPPPQG